MSANITYIWIFKIFNHRERQNQVVTPTGLWSHRSYITLYTATEKGSHLSLSLSIGVVCDRSGYSLCKTSNAMFMFFSRSVSSWSIVWMSLSDLSKSMPVILSARTQPSETVFWNIQIISMTTYPVISPTMKTPKIKSFRTLSRYTKILMKPHRTSNQ